jgi:hypothetical protein
MFSAPLLLLFLQPPPLLLRPRPRQISPASHWSLLHLAVVAPAWQMGTPSQPANAVLNQKGH